MENKKKWLVAIVLLAVVAAVTVAVTMKGKFFKGFIGGGPATCEEGAKGCPTTGPVTPGPATKPPTTGPVTPGPDTSQFMTRGLFITDLVRTAPGVDKTVVNNSKNCFKDVVGHKLEKYICYGVSKGWAKGNPDGNFKPDDLINRVESAKLIVNVFEIKLYVAKKPLANDVLEGEWYYDYANTLIRTGFPNAIPKTDYGGKFFYPSSILTKADGEAWLLYAKKLKK